MCYLRFKNSLDFLMALGLLIVTLPFFMVLFFFYYLLSPLKWNQLFFVQERIGKNERVFKVYKIRTLTVSLESEFRSGQFLRLTGLDEWPQLINILWGDMSFIGPRPLLPEYLELYSNDQKRRHLVKPGVTGLVQVNGGKTLSWEYKLNLDICYVNNFGFQQDVVILLKTIILFLSFRRFKEEDNRERLKK